ncbi:hypothetical protein [Arthrobacter sp.]|uniref:hypothetical protein n=1 Tax=Arthrobacter sp. TaxID=1667 RepID=UPI003A91D03F
MDGQPLSAKYREPSPLAVFGASGSRWLDSYRVGTLAAEGYLFFRSSSEPELKHDFQPSQVPSATSVCHEDQVDEQKPSAGRTKKQPAFATAESIQQAKI